MPKAGKPQGEILTSGNSVQNAKPGVNCKPWQTLEATAVVLSQETLQIKVWARPEGRASLPSVTSVPMERAFKNWAHDVI